MKSPDDSTPRNRRRSALRCQQTWRDGWLELSLPKRRASITGEPGCPGFWKPSRDGKNLVFELPARVLAVSAAALPEESSWIADQPSEKGPLNKAVLKWALATASGNLPSGWAPPPAELLADLLPAAQRIVRHRDLVREIEVIHGSRQLALRVQLAPADPARPKQRREWLEKFAASANAIWRLVRIGFAPDSGALVAEVNLTGVPAAVLPPLFQAAHDSLRWIVSGLAETADFLARADSGSRALDVLSAE